MFWKIYLTALFVFLVIDVTWLGLIAKNFYRKHMGFLMKSEVDWIPALLLYMLFVAALVLFVINPAIEKESWMHALLFGAFFGLVAYASYDLTNLATIKNWPMVVTLVDIAWGATVSASVSVITYFIVTKIF